MSHIHIPDGVLPLWIVVVSWVVTAALLALSVRSLRSRESSRRLPLLGVMSALMLVAMSLALVPIGYHINFTVISGIVLGPTLALPAAFVVNLILAFFGHGGITVVGVNSLVIAAEMVLGYYLFRAGQTILAGKLSPGLLAGVVTVIALATSTLLMIGIVGVSSIDPGIAFPEAAAVEPGTLSFRNPFGEGVVEWRPFGGEHETAARPSMDLATFARLVLGLSVFGWVIEAFITAIAVGYLASVRPDLIGVTRRPTGG